MRLFNTNIIILALFGATPAASTDARKLLESTGKRAQQWTARQRKNSSDALAEEKLLREHSEQNARKNAEHTRKVLAARRQHLEKTARDSAERSREVLAAQAMMEISGKRRQPPGLIVDTQNHFPRSGAEPPKPFFSPIRVRKTANLNKRPIPTSGGLTSSARPAGTKKRKPSLPGGRLRFSNLPSVPQDSQQAQSVFMPGLELHPRMLEKSLQFEQAKAANLELKQRPFQLGQQLHKQQQHQTQRPRMTSLQSESSSCPMVISPREMSE